MRNPLSPASAAPLENDDLLTEILLRLPPQPSSLPRASSVCKRWRRLVSDPGFVRHFRIHHRRNPPLLGFFRGLNFIPTMDPTNRVPYGYFSLQLDRWGRDDHTMWFNTLGCRHGLVLIFLPKRLQLLVWDPITSDQHPIATPPGFAQLVRDGGGPVHGAVLRAAGDVHHFQFQVVMVFTVEQQLNVRAVVQVYSSETGTWGNPISTPLPPQESSSTILFPNEWVPDVLVGDSLYWLLGKSNILEIHLDRQRLAVIPLPVAAHMYAESNCEFSVMRADGGGLGCLVISEFSAQLWKRKTDCDGVASWVPGRSIELDKLLSLNTHRRAPLKILGYAEENSVLLLQTDFYGFTIQLQSLQFHKFFDTNYGWSYHPFESVYPAVTVNGGVDDAAEVLDKI
uniref:Uncharacterized protein n=1 Tax=Avena sativa TaxID=4498 RepID=A0ACD5Z8R3_AVESA